MFRNNLVYLIYFFFLFLVVVTVFLLQGYYGFVPCRGWYGKPKYTGKNEGLFISQTEFMDLMSVKACITSVGNTEDILFSENSKRFTIAFYDKFWRRYDYPVRIGGKTNDGNALKVGLCKINSRGVFECNMVGPEDVVNNLKIGQVVGIDLVYKDDFDWPGKEQDENNFEYIDKIKNAIEKGVGFPNLGKANGFVIQAVQVSI